MKLSLALSILVSLFVGTSHAGDKRTNKQLIDADRVVLLGGGFIEQERLHCYLETRLLRHHPRGQMLFRNLGWGGDDVRGSARTGGFENPQGFARLLKEVTQWKPTVLFVGYGMNESFAGSEGIAAFAREYGVLLDKLAPLEARTILLSPTYHEPLGPAYPDATEHNEHLEAYADAIRELARKRDIEYIDLFHAMKKAKVGEPGRIFTTNGIQPNGAGYALIARAVEDALEYSGENRRRITVSANGVVKDAAGATVKVETTKRGLRLLVHEATLAMADPLGKEELFLRVLDLAEGMYALEMQGKEKIRATAEAWGQGLHIPAGEQAGERLRQAIVAKSELFYRRWRPFNDHSRHFNFLKGDFSLYDSAIAEQERTIQLMLTPRPSTLEIVPLGK